MPFALRRIWTVEAYQGGDVSRRYFEGWYYKQVDAAAARAIALIPGVSYSADGSAKHSFVQVVPSGGEARYFAFPAGEFTWDASPPFGVRVGSNVFGRGGISLDIDREDGTVRGELRFGPWSPWPVTPISPGIMGPFRFVPGMETYHGVLSMDHAVSGWIEIDGERIDLDGGRGYTEKDWGRSFPSSWVWAQSNHFGVPGTSVTVSVGRIPWITGAFVGHIAGLLIDGRLHRFATYTGAKVTCIFTGPAEAELTLDDRHEELQVRLHGSATLALKAPVLGSMEGRDAESLGGTIDVVLRELRGGRGVDVFRGTGVQAGIEIMNDRDELGHAPCPEPEGPDPAELR